MYPLTTHLQTHFAQECTTLAECWKATLADGAVYGFTDHDRDVEVDGVIYAAATGFNASSVVQTSGLAVDNGELVGLIDSAVIVREEVIAGRWDNAVIEHFIVDYTTPAGGKRPLPGVTLGEFRVLDETVTAESRGIKQRLQQVIGWTVQPGCRNDLGDAKCTVDLEARRVSLTVAAIDGQQNFTDTSRAEADDYFGGGEISWLTGANAGLSMDIRDFVNDAGQGAFTLLLPMPYAIAVGDTATIVPGCRKRFTQDCKTKYGNLPNFNGEPRVPGLIAVLRVPT